MAFLIPMDPVDMARNFSEDNRLVGMSTGETFRSPLADMTKVHQALSVLPTRERDMLELYFFRGKNQSEIGKIFDVTQGDVSYRISRAVERVKFFLGLPKVCMRRMIGDLHAALKNIQHVRIMVLMLRTTSQTVVGERVGLTQGKVRYRFLKSIEALRDQARTRPIYHTYVKIFEMVSRNFNIMRSLEPQERWANKFE